MYPHGPYKNSNQRKCTQDVHSMVNKLNFMIISVYESLS